MTGAERMNLLRKPPEALTQPEMVYWLERMRFVYRHMSLIIKNPTESPYVRETAKHARENALFTGRMVLEQLKIENPSHPSIKGSLIPNDIPITKQWEKLKQYEL